MKKLILTGTLALTALTSGAALLGDLGRADEVVTPVEGAVAYASPTEVTNTVREIGELEFATFEQGRRADAEYWPPLMRLNQWFRLPWEPALFGPDQAFLSGTVDFNGSTDRGVWSDDFTDADYPLSYECYFRTSYSGGLQWIAGYWTAGSTAGWVSTRIESAGNIRVWIDNGGSTLILDTGGSFNDGESHHLQVFHEADGSCRAYVDGVKYTSAVSKAMPATLDAFVVGAAYAPPQGGNFWFNGDIWGVKTGITEPVAVGTDIDVHIITGQSNTYYANGTNGAAHLIDLVQPHLYYQDADGAPLITDGQNLYMTHEQRWGPELELGYQITRQLGTTNVIIKIGDGSTKIGTQWQPEAGPTDGYHRAVDLISTAFDDLIAKGYNPVVKTWSWILGETDSTAAINGENWFPDWTRAHTNIANDVGIDPWDPAVFIHKVNSDIVYDYEAETRAGQQLCADNYGNVTTIDGDEFSQQGDNLHYDSYGQIKQGLFIFNSYEKYALNFPNVGVQAGPLYDGSSLDWYGNINSPLAEDSGATLYNVDTNGVDGTLIGSLARGYGDDQLHSNTRQGWSADGAVYVPALNGTDAQGNPTENLPISGWNKSEAQVVLYDGSTNDYATLEAYIEQGDPIRSRVTPQGILEVLVYPVTLPVDMPEAFELEKYLGN